MSDHDSKHSVKLINDECSKTLEELTLQNCEGKIFDQLRNPFEVKILSILTSKNCAIQFTKNTRKLNELFPHVSTLILIDFKESEWAFLGEFPLLTQFSLMLPESQNEQNFNESHIVDFLKQNTHVSGIQIGNSNLKLFQKICKFTPNLKILTLRFFAENFWNIKLMKNDLIYFDTVISLSIYSDRPSDKMHEKIIFNVVEVFSLFIRDDFNENWMRFIGKQINKRLTEIMIEARTLDRGHFLDIANQLPIIEFATIHTESFYEANDIVQFLNRVKRLEELHVICEMNECERNLLNNLLEKNWLVTAIFNPINQMTDITVER